MTSGKKLGCSDKFTFPLNQLDAIVLDFFTRTTQNQNGIINYPAVEQRQDHDEVRQV